MRSRVVPRHLRGDVWVRRQARRLIPPGCPGHGNTMTGAGVIPPVYRGSTVDMESAMGKPRIATAASIALVSLALAGGAQAQQAKESPKNAKAAESSKKPQAQA